MQSALVPNTFENIIVRYTTKIERASQRASSEPSVEAYERLIGLRTELATVYASHDDRILHELAQEQLSLAQSDLRFALEQKDDSYHPEKIEKFCKVQMAQLDALGKKLVNTMPDHYEVAFLGTTKTGKTETGLSYSDAILGFVGNSLQSIHMATRRIYATGTANGNILVPFDPRAEPLKPWDYAKALRAFGKPMIFSTEHAHSDYDGIDLHWSDMERKLVDAAKPLVQEEAADSNVRVAGRLAMELGLVARHFQQYVDDVEKMEQAILEGKGTPEQRADVERCHAGALELIIGRAIESIRG